MYVTANFECGNIEIAAIDGNRAWLKIKPDPDPQFLQWFYFRCISKRRARSVFEILNAGECTFKEAWKDCCLVASYDLENWFRIPTEYNGSSLKFSIDHDCPSVHIATFAPYTSVRRERLIARCQTVEGLDADIVVYGESVEQRPLKYLKMGQGPRKVWIIAAQHPGEPMAEWCVEGFIQRLMDSHDATARAVLRKAQFRIVPNANPDGSYNGYIRTNAAGIDLNRVWQSGDATRSPEVQCLKKEMEKTGVDVFIDIHGDEEIPHVFFSNADGVPSITPERIAMRRTFEAALAVANPDFEPGHGYPQDKPGEADLSIGSKYVGEHFPCLSLTLEQPFRDDRDNEEGFRGWSPERSARLGGSLLVAINAVL